MAEQIGKMIIEMPNGIKETIEVWHKQDSQKMLDMISQINPHYWAILGNVNPYGKIRAGLGKMLQVVRILKKSNGQVIWDTIPPRIWKIAEREAILLRLE